MTVKQRLTDAMPYDRQDTHQLSGIVEGELNSSADGSITSLSIRSITCAVLRSIGDIEVVEMSSRSAIRNWYESCHGRVDIVVIEDIAHLYPLPLAILRTGNFVSVIDRHRLFYPDGRKGWPSSIAVVQE